MSVSSETYIVISLMFAVFAAVAAVGTSLVLGIGFERLRAGFDIVRKQTGFFADAIHKLDQRTAQLNERTESLQNSMASMTQKVERVEHQTVFFSDALQSLQQQISDQATPVTQTPSDPFEGPVLPQNFETLSLGIPTLPERAHDEAVVRTLAQFHMPTPSNDVPSGEPVKSDTARTASIANLLTSYWRTEARVQPSAQQVIYH
ncbi:MAG: hypothetical protein J0L77_09315 [Alphaproteobacteria bacterium]|nr:hypothetical protein [Alphaproteobacteria bacterium]